MARIWHDDEEGFSWEKRGKKKASFSSFLIFAVAWTCGLWSIYGKNILLLLWHKRNRDQGVVFSSDGGERRGIIFTLRYHVAIPHGIYFFLARSLLSCNVCCAVRGLLLPYNGYTWTTDKFLNIILLFNKTDW